MSNPTVKYLANGCIVVALVVLCLFVYGVLHSPAPKLGGIVQGTRTLSTTIDGNIASTTVAGQSGVYINPAVTANATSTLIAAINDADDLSFFGAIIASSSVAAQVGVQFQESDTAGCSINTASTTWYSLAPVTASISGTLVNLATTTAFIYNPGSSTTPQAFLFKVPFAPAQCIKASVYAQNTVVGNYQIWYGFDVQKKGYNNPQ